MILLIWQQTFTVFPTTKISFNLKVIIEFETQSDIKDRIKELSEDYLNYKGLFDFSSNYKGICKGEGNTDIAWWGQP